MSKSQESKQGSLSFNQVKNYIARGPIFDSKYLHTSKAKYVVAGLVGVVVAVGLFVKFRGTEETNSNTTAQSAVISQVVAHNDSQTRLARRALADYTGSHLELSLSSAQKLFIETSLAQAHKGSRLQVGAMVEFQTEEIKTLIAKSQTLTPFQLQAWSTLARNVKF